MSSVPSPIRLHEPASAHGLFFYRMQLSDIDDVLAIENDLYPFPWTHGNFVDSIRSEYETWVLRDGRGTMYGYFLLMLLVDDAHLLNISVHRNLQGKGIGLLLLDKARSIAVDNKLESMLLEVRPSNERAAKIYVRYGFDRIGIRKGYYPAPNNTREDAIVMKLML
ncbi:MAG: ribosomal protein S18-alanine N-acetyltransferase [Oxalicibacterium faecigallinarum]|uniref:[Ribosomal protein bS18]-alanine N-acetyltransferase n=1 Tax=Oxalicibacterium faecigallinarum TaxID=573741 RepID=A0A8J3ANX2_9BURK|nr:ribosomal protein S18-alanine N-acetyltransferase [Oxalicibacterium faecigallinarum]MDQ7969220.1 ribosomal protein S18-alanine N-acetyltransferase [Oxalicibacterium faecigallinarum]GGI17348.1 ribosomal-protein-alanine acetyltransferase [Oxalicibacterium faecigallinarum]